MASTADHRSEDNSLELVHPVYLDIPMMVSFVAALEGGVSYGAERTEIQAHTDDRDREAGGRLGIPLLSSLLSLDMTGRLSSKSGDASTEEVKVVRRHTEASLFNLLRHRLLAESKITQLDKDDRLADLNPGQLVEISGEVTGNPLQQLFDLLVKIMPYLGLDENAIREPQKAKKQKQGNPRSGNPATRAAAQQESSDQDQMSDDDALRFLFIMKDDLEGASVRDVVFDGDCDISTVLTLSTEFFTSHTTDYVLGGRFRVLGKVTRVLDDDGTINLTRRTALGAAGPEIAREIIEGATSDNELFIEVADPIVSGPALQVLPLAVFV